MRAVSLVAAQAAANARAIGGGADRGVGTPNCDCMVEATERSTSAGAVAGCTMAAGCPAGMSRSDRRAAQSSAIQKMDHAPATASSGARGDGGLSRRAHDVSVLPGLCSTPRSNAGYPMGPGPTSVSSARGRSTSPPARSPSPTRPVQAPLPSQQTTTPGARRYAQPTSESERLRRRQAAGATAIKIGMGNDLYPGCAAPPNAPTQSSAADSPRGVQMLIHPPRTPAIPLRESEKGAEQKHMQRMAGNRRDTPPLAAGASQCESTRAPAASTHDNAPAATVPRQPPARAGSPEAAVTSTTEYSIGCAAAATSAARRSMLGTLKLGGYDAAVRRAMMDVASPRGVAALPSPPVLATPLPQDGLASEGLPTNEWSQAACSPTVAQIKPATVAATSADTTSHPGDAVEHVASPLSSSPVPSTPAPSIVSQQLHLLAVPQSADQSPQGTSALQQLPSQSLSAHSHVRSQLVITTSTPAPTTTAMIYSMVADSKEVASSSGHQAGSSAQSTSCVPPRLGALPPLNSRSPETSERNYVPPPASPSPDCSIAQPATRDLVLPVGREESDNAWASSDMKATALPRVPTLADVTTLDGILLGPGPQVRFGEATKASGVESCARLPATNLVLIPPCALSVLPAARSRSPDEEPSS